LIFLYQRRYADVSYESLDLIASDVNTLGNLAELSLRSACACLSGHAAAPVEDDISASCPKRQGDPVRSLVYTIVRSVVHGIVS